MITIERDAIYTLEEVLDTLDIGKHKLLAAIRDGAIKAIPSKRYKYLFLGSNIIVYIANHKAAVEEAPAPAPEQRKPRNVIRRETLWEHSRKCLKAS